MLRNCWVSSKIKYYLKYICSSEIVKYEIPVVITNASNDALYTQILILKNWTRAIHSKGGKVEVLISKFWFVVKYFINFSSHNENFYLISSVQSQRLSFVGHSALCIEGHKTDLYDVIKIFQTKTWNCLAKMKGINGPFHFNKLPLARGTQIMQCRSSLNPPNQKVGARFIFFHSARFRDPISLHAPNGFWV